MYKMLRLFLEQEATLHLVIDFVSTPYFQQFTYILKNRQLFPKKLSGCNCLIVLILTYTEGRFLFFFEERSNAFLTTSSFAVVYNVISVSWPSFSLHSIHSLPKPYTSIDMFFVFIYIDIKTRPPNFLSFFPQTSSLFQTFAFSRRMKSQRRNRAMRRYIERDLYQIFEKIRPHSHSKFKFKTHD